MCLRNSVCRRDRLDRLHTISHCVISLKCTVKSILTVSVSSAIVLFVDVTSSQVEAKAKSRWLIAPVFTSLCLFSSACLSLEILIFIHSLFTYTYPYIYCTLLNCTLVYSSASFVCPAISKSITCTVHSVQYCTSGHKLTLQYCGYAIFLLNIKCFVLFCSFSVTMHSVNLSSQHTSWPVEINWTRSYCRCTEFRLLAIAGIHLYIHCKTRERQKRRYSFAKYNSEVRRPLCLQLLTYCDLFLLLDLADE